MNEQSLSIIKANDYGVVLRDSNRRNNAGFPTKFVEYKTLGTSVIANHFSDIYNYNSKGDIFINELSEEEIGNALLIALKNKKQSREKYTLFDYRNYIDSF